jgi:DNA-directed RNA polymerase specialized sigma24 family protein
MSKRILIIGNSDGIGAPVTKILIELGDRVVGVSRSRRPLAGQSLRHEIQDAAEDVLVEAFWRAYRGRARFDPARSFGAWMRRIATNAALDHLKKVRGHTEQMVDANATPPTDADSGLRKSIAIAFQRLPTKRCVVEGASHYLDLQSKLAASSVLPEPLYLAICG